MNRFQKSFRGNKFSQRNCIIISQAFNGQMIRLPQGNKVKTFNKQMSFDWTCSPWSFAGQMVSFKWPNYKCKLSGTYFQVNMYRIL